jgi:hypothetical protein
MRYPANNARMGPATNAMLWADEVAVVTEDEVGMGGKVANRPTAKQLYERPGRPAVAAVASGQAEFSPRA